LPDSRLRLPHALAAAARRRYDEETARCDRVVRPAHASPTPAPARSRASPRAGCPTG
jgi:hypothetical protein